MYILMVLCLHGYICKETRIYSICLNQIKPTDGISPRMPRSTTHNYHISVRCARCGVSWHHSNFCHKNIWGNASNCIVAGLPYNVV